MSRLRLIAIGIAAALIIAGLLAVRSCILARPEQQAASARAGQARAEAQVDAAAEATAITANSMTYASEVDALTRTNADAIQAAPGADTPIPAAAADAGLRALCMRAAYRAEPRCTALLGPRPGAAGS